MGKKRRRRVVREERVRPPPEAAKHHRVWPMQKLLVAGPDGGGIDADEFEAAVQMVETYKVLVAELGVAAVPLENLALRSSTPTTIVMTDRDAERIVTWFEMSVWLPLGASARLVRQIEDYEPIASVRLLRRACRIWDRIRRETKPPPLARA